MKLFHIFWETTIHVHFDNSTDLNVPDLVRVAYTYIYMYNRKLFQELYTRVHDIGIILFSKTRRTRKIDTYRACACARVRANTYDVYLSLSAVSRHIRNVTTRHLSRRDTRYVWRLFFFSFFHPTRIARPTEHTFHKSWSNVPSNTSPSPNTRFSVE